MSIELKLSRSNRIYRPNETLEGKIITNFPSSISHQGIRITVTGDVNLQVRGGSAGVIESLVGAVKPLRIMKESVEVRSPGKLSSGTTEIPFAMILQEGKDGFEKFYETFHGANISIQYLVTTDLVRGYLHKSLSATVEFLIESKKTNLLRAPVSPEMVSFYITQDTQRHPLLPELFSGGFRISGKIVTQCSMSDPLSGELTVEASAVPINSIDIHILRIESILVGEKIVSESSLIQTTQIADGDVCRNMALPIYVILPRLLTCPTVAAGLNATTGFTIHGLWTDYNDGTWPSCCGGAKFDLKEVRPLLDGLQKYWPSLSCGLTSTCHGVKGLFWAHEWEKHGTCSYPVFKDEYNYFLATLNLYLKYNVAEILSENGYVPSNTEKYPLGGIVSAIQNAVRATPELTCTNGAIEEVHLCFYKNFEPRDCVLGGNGVGSSSCPTYVSLPVFVPLNFQGANRPWSSGVAAF